MKITITGNAKEIAALVLAVQERQERKLNFLSPHKVKEMADNAIKGITVNLDEATRDTH